MNGYSVFNKTPIGLFTSFDYASTIFSYNKKFSLIISSSNFSIISSSSSFKSDKSSDVFLSPYSPDKCSFFLAIAKGIRTMIKTIKMTINTIKRHPYLLLDYINIIRNKTQKVASLPTRFPRFYHFTIYM